VAKLCLNEIKRRNLGDRFITLVRSKLGSKKLQSLVENEAGKLTMKFIKELFSLDEKYLLRTCFEATEYTLETMIGAILAYKSQIVDSDELVESVLSEIILLCQSEQYAYNESDCLTAFKIYRQLELQKVLIEDMPLPKKPVKKESLAEIATKLLLDGEPYPKAVLAMIGDGFAASLKDTSHSLVLPEEDEGAIVESEIYRALVQEVLSKYKEIMGPELGWVAGIFSKKILSPGRHHIEFLSSFAKMDVISEPHCVSVLLCLLFSICDPEHADQTAPINIKYKELLVSNLARLGIAIVFDEKFKSPIAVNFNKDLNRRSFSEVSTIVDSSDFPEPAGKWLQNVLDKIGCKSSAPVNH
jgi:hypothetical protein